MNYKYDGSFDGILTLIFDKYNEIGNISINNNDLQLDFFESVFIETNLKKSERVLKKLEDSFGEYFIRDILNVFKSNHPKKEEIIANVIKASLIYGNDYINSDKRWAIEMRDILRKFSHELHAYKGLLRFREIQDGYLLAEFEPENDILEYLTIHFMKRMPNEKFLIYDKNRKKASLCIKGNYEKVEIIEMDAVESDEEVFFKDAWKSFYKTISIKERENKNLMINNMPKKYRKYLPEKM